MNDSFDSTSDRRIENNIMRHEYRLLTPDEKEQMRRIKDAGLDLVAELHKIGGTNPKEMRQASRELALAQTKAEECVMWAVKHLTG